MTDRIDLDEMDVDSTDEPDANYGDWFWRDEGDPKSEPDPDERWLDAGGTTGDREADSGEGGSTTAEESTGTNGDEDDESVTDGEEGADGKDRADGEDGAEADAVGDTDDRSNRDPVPGVPRQNRDGPVGIPVEKGGAGAGPAGWSRAGGTTVPGNEEPAVTGDDTAGPGSAEGTGGGEETSGVASGPHGGGVDEMTMALTYEAVKRFADPRFAVIDAKSWTDWIGIIGDVPAHVINRFQREHEINVDFFSGAGQEPAERLADVDEHSMFYAERMVLVGVAQEGEEGIADRAGWEFVPLETAAEKADWDLTDPDSDSTG